MECGPSRTLGDCLKETGQILKVWGNDTFGNINNTLEKARKEVGRLVS